METRTRKLRAELNRILQPCKTEAQLRAECKGFQARHGSTIWHVPTGHNGDVDGPYAETFASLASQHLSRVVEDDKWEAHAADQEKNILERIQGCGSPEFYNLVQFVNRRPALLDRADVMDALNDRGRFLELPEYCDEVAA